MRKLSISCHSYPQLHPHIFASCFLVTVEESESVLSQANPCSRKMHPTGAVPLLEGCSQTSMTPQGRTQEVNTPSHLPPILFSCWCFLLTEPTGSQMAREPIDAVHKVSLSWDTGQRGEGGE